MKLDHSTAAPAAPAAAGQTPATARAAVDRNRPAAISAVSRPTGGPHRPGRSARTPDEYLTDLPPVPAVALKVMRLVDQPGTTGLELARTIALDQAITFKVLQLANSAEYGYRRQIMTLSQAIAVLGMRRIRSLVMLHAIPAGLTQSVCREPAEKLLWEHAVNVGLLSRQLAQRAGGVDPEAVFLAGLLHDVGKTILHIRAPREMAGVLEACGASGGPASLEAERGRFGFDHRELGGRALELWGLPPLFPVVARWHHQPELAPGFRREAQLVAAANRTTRHMAKGGAGDPAARAEALGLAGPLGLEADQLEAAAVIAANQLAMQRSLYNL